MTGTREPLLDRMAHRRMLRRWQALARTAEEAAPATLRELRQRARDARRPLDQIIATADRRLGLLPARATETRHPPGTDWFWRPDPWIAPLPDAGWAPLAPRQPIGAQTATFHDCPLGEIALRQLRGTGPRETAPHTLAIEIYGFSGSFLSLVVDFPPEGVAGLGTRHIVQLDLTLSSERPQATYARLQVRHGPNVAQILQNVPAGPGTHRVEFDLAYSGLEDRPVEHAWLDLIFEKPQMTAITLHDLTLSRRPRAGF